MNFMDIVASFTRPNSLCIERTNELIEYGMVRFSPKAMLTKQEHIQLMNNTWRAIYTINPNMQISWNFIHTIAFYLYILYQLELKYNFGPHVRTYLFHFTLIEYKKDWVVYAEKLWYNMRKLNSIINEYKMVYMDYWYNNGVIAINQGCMKGYWDNRFRFNKNSKYGIRTFYIPMHISHFWEYYLFTVLIQTYTIQKCKVPEDVLFDHKQSLNQVEKWNIINNIRHNIKHIDYFHFKFDELEIHMTDKVILTYKILKIEKFINTNFTFGKNHLPVQPPLGWDDIEPDYKMDDDIVYVPSD